MKEDVEDSVIQLRDIRCKISNKEILKGITLEVKRGEIMGLLGENGAGKSTLLSIISGLRRHTSGEINILEERAPAQAIGFRRRMGVVFQENALYEELTVFENLSFSASLYDVQNPKERIIDSA